MTSDFQVGREVGQVESDFTEQVYVVNRPSSKVSDQGRQVKNTPKTSDAICECSLRGHDRRAVQKLTYQNKTKISKIKIVA